MNKTVINDRWSKFQGENPSVCKYVYADDKIVTESVLYTYSEQLGGIPQRVVICCSVMSGCPVGCTFCGTGKKFLSNLKAEEIVEQVKFVLADSVIKVTDATRFQIMFMSMGEPFLNYSEVRAAVIELNKLYPSAELLVSTIGCGSDADFLDFIDLSIKIPKIGLQYSIHEAFDITRDQKIPYPHKLTLREIRDRGILWWSKVQRPVFLNYCVHENNSKYFDINVLKNLFSPIAFNFTFSVICNSEIGKASEESRTLMEHMLRAFSPEFNVRAFDPAGKDDIGAGCSQLWYVQEYMKQRSGK